MTLIPGVLDSTLIAYQKRSISVSQLEDRANSETDNPKAQVKYMEVSYMTVEWMAS